MYLDLIWKKGLTSHHALLWCCSLPEVFICRSTFDLWLWKVKVIIQPSTIITHWLTYSGWFFLHWSRFGETCWIFVFYLRGNDVNRLWVFFQEGQTPGGGEEVSRWFLISFISFLSHQWFLFLLAAEWAAERQLNYCWGNWELIKLWYSHAASSNYY